MSKERQISDDIINDLHLKKSQAIDALDFENAEHFFQEIENEKAKKAQNLFAVVKNETLQKLQKLLAQNTEKKKKFVEENRKLESRLYSKYQILFNETQEDHVHQLVDLEKERGYALLQVAEEEVPEQIELLEQAKHEAYLSNFSGAKELREKARQIGEVVLAQRQQAIEDDYAMKKEELIARQKAELDQITELHSQEDQKLREEKEERLQKLEFEFQNSITILEDELKVKIIAIETAPDVQDEALEDTIESISEIIDDYCSKPEITAELTQKEQMRLKGVSPSQLAVNRNAPTPSSSVLRTASRTRAAATTTATTKTGLKPVSGTSTAFLSRQCSSNSGRK